MNEAIFWLSVHMNPATSQNIEAPYEKFCCFSSYFKISFLILRENDTSNPNYYYFHQLIFLLITEINKDIKKEKTSNHDFIT